MALAHRSLGAFFVVRTYSVAIDTYFRLAPLGELSGVGHSETVMRLPPATFKRATRDLARRYFALQRLRFLVEKAETVRASDLRWARTTAAPARGHEPGSETTNKVAN